VVSSFYSEITYSSHTKKQSENSNNSNRLFTTEQAISSSFSKRIRRKNWEVTRKTENHKVYDDDAHEKVQLHIQLQCDSSSNNLHSNRYTTICTGIAEQRCST